jgi:hypothetical protein
MPRTRAAVIGLLAVALACALGAGDERAGWDFKSRPAQAAKKKLDELVAKAEEDYFRRVGVAREMASRELTDAMRAATKAGDLDEANKIKQALSDLAGGAPGPGSGRGLVGRWDAKYTNGYRRDYEIRPDGAIAWSEAAGPSGRGKIRREEGGAWLIPDDGAGNAERWTLVGDRVFIEHFHPSARYPKDGANHMAVAARAGKKAQ